MIAFLLQATYLKGCSEVCFVASMHRQIHAIQRHWKISDTWRHNNQFVCSLMGLILGSLNKMLIDWPSSDRGPQLAGWFRLNMLLLLAFTRCFHLAPINNTVINDSHFFVLVTAFANLILRIELAFAKTNIFNYFLKRRRPGTVMIEKFCSFWQQKYHLYMQHIICFLHGSCKLNRNLNLIKNACVSNYNYGNDCTTER